MKTGIKTTKTRLWKTCTSKKRYRDEHRAYYDSKRFSKIRGVELDYYWCPYCNGFHITSQEYSRKFLEINLNSEVAVG